MNNLIIHRGEYSVNGSSHKEDCKCDLGGEEQIADAACGLSVGTKQEANAEAITKSLRPALFEKYHSEGSIRKDNLPVVYKNQHQSSICVFWIPRFWDATKNTLRYPKLGYFKEPVGKYTNNDEINCR